MANAEQITGQIKEQTQQAIQPGQQYAAQAVDIVGSRIKTALTQLLDKATEAASDLAQKVTTAAQTAVHDAAESGKAEAENQGLAPQDEAPAAVDCVQDEAASDNVRGRFLPSAFWVHCFQPKGEDKLRQHKHWKL